MSTINSKLVEEITKKRGDLRWLGGFAVFGSLLVLPGLLPITEHLSLDSDPRQIGARFLAFNLGFLLVSAISSPLLRKFGVRPFAIVGLLIAIGACVAVLLQRVPLALSGQLVPALAFGMAAAAISMSCLFALKPWSSRLGARALPRVTEFSCLGCTATSLAAGGAYASGWGRFTPIPIAVGALVWLLFCLGGRRPLTVVEKRSSLPDASVRQRRSIAQFLLLCLLFVQLGSEWSIAGWLPLFLMHRLGSGPSLAIFTLSCYFGALLAGRWLIQKIEPKIGARTLAIFSLILVLGGCLALSFSSALTGILVGLGALAIGFAQPYSTVKSILDESLHFAPGFYRAILTVAVTGAMSSAWLLGYVHQFLGIGALPLFPAAGSLLVLVLQWLLIFEAHLMGERTSARPGLPATDRRTS